MSRDKANPAKFPSTAVPLLIDEMRTLGASVERMSAKIVGGASMFGALIPSGGINIGERNVLAVREVLAEVKVPIVAEDTGGDYGRSVFLHLGDGQVEVRSVRRGSSVL
jgi:chemotaxis protein CheD